MSCFVALRRFRCLLPYAEYRKYHSVVNKIKLYNINDGFHTAIKFVSQGYGREICWKCGMERKNYTDLFCSQCKVIQKPYNSENFFKVFSISEQFDIDPKILKEKYRKLQNNLHPDRFANSTAEEKKISENYSSLVNKAYNCLLAPLKRAEHLLKLNGSAVEDNRIPVDTDFLMEMMELNEEVENTVDPVKLKELNLKNRKELDKLAAEIDECFKQNDLDKAKKYVVKMQYYTSLGNRINIMLRELGVVD